MIESQSQENISLSHHDFLTVLSQFYSAVERTRKQLTLPAQFTSERKCFSVKFPILKLYPLFENVAKYRSEFSLHDVVLAWQTVFWMAEHHQLDTIFEYFFRAYKLLKALYESFNK
jgi:hypothetical protein